MKKSLLITLFLGASLSLFAQQNNCTPPVITSVTGGGSHCPGETATLEVNGELNSATGWAWYAESCGGALIGTGASLSFTVDSAATYYVRATGRCTDDNTPCTAVEIRLDDIGPEISCIEDVVVVNDPDVCGAIVSFEIPSAVDACSDTVYIQQTEGPPSGSLFPVGSTTITFEARDTVGNVSVCTFVVTVEDQELPEITCSPDLVFDNDPGECGAIVTYEVPVGTDNCPGAVTEQTAGLGSGAFFPVGTTVETYAVTDAAGNTASCSFSVTVNDVEPPVITLLDKKTVLWPPNHKPHEVAIVDYIDSVWDNCGGITIDDVIIDEIGSDEPVNDRGDGNTEDDIVISENCRKADLLAERAGMENGRVYLVTVAVMDLHGNIGTAQFVVEAPHDKGKKHTTQRDSIQYIVNGCDLIFEEEVVEVDSTASDGLTNGRIGEQTEATVFPNPFKNSLTVTLRPALDDEVSVELYNLMGMRIATLVHESVNANQLYNWTFAMPPLEGSEYLVMVRGFNTRQMMRIIRRE